MAEQRKIGERVVGDLNECQTYNLIGTKLCGFDLHSLTLLKTPRVQDISPKHSSVTNSCASIITNGKTFCIPSGYVYQSSSLISSEIPINAAVTRSPSSQGMNANASDHWICTMASTIKTKLFAFYVNSKKSQIKFKCRKKGRNEKEILDHFHLKHQQCATNCN